MSRVVAHLRRDGLLIYPTETAYALGCDATNARAVRAIFRLKGRERGKPLPLIVASSAMAERYARFTPLARKLAKQYWPGAFTIVVASRLTPAISPPLTEGEREGVGVGSARRWGQLAPGILAPDGTLALRVSSHPIARALSRRLGRPIVSTSANRSGQSPRYSAHAALHSLQPSNGAQRDVTYSTRGRVQNMSRSTRVFRVRGSGVPALVIIDGGPLTRRHPSTIVDTRGDRPIVLRHGVIRMG